MQSVATTFLSVACICLSGCLPRVGLAPPDFQMRTLDLPIDVQLADIVVLGTVTGRQDLARFSAEFEWRPEPLRIVETEVTLQVVRIIKGEYGFRELRFRHYDSYGYSASGPPSGPSGPLRTMGIYFIRRGSEGVFRSTVDLYRPDLPTPWLTEAPKSRLCSRPADCIAQLLLHFEPGYDVDSFAARLLANTANARQLVGVTHAFVLLRQITYPNTPDKVKHGACRELSKWYVLEMPDVCKSVLVEELGQEYSMRVTNLRNELRNKGLSWIFDRINSKDETDVIAYCEILKASADPETRQLAKGLRGLLRADGTFPARKQ